MERNLVQDRVLESARYEIKMACDEVYLPDVRSWVRLHPDAFIEAYPPRRVNNLYLDTHEVDGVNDNLVGTRERGKLRLRWYGRDFSAVRGNLELKFKSNQLGWKQSCPIPVTFDLTTISWNELLQQLRKHVQGDLAVWLSRVDRPVLINGYTREYYESMDRQIRVTIDYDQMAYEQVTYASPNLVSSSYIDRHVVVEVKSDAALHSRVSNVLSSFPLRTARYSKYVRGVTDSLHFL
jgi:hypothetical protein